MRDYKMEFNRNIEFTDFLLRPIFQSILKHAVPKSLCGWFGHLWPLWVNSAWIMCFGYLIIVERAELELVAQQIWCMNSATQTLVKYLNGVIKYRKIQELLQWCKSIYAGTEKANYKPIVDKVFHMTNLSISRCIRINTLFLALSVVFYLITPIISWNYKTPTVISMDGNSDWCWPAYIAIYTGQSLLAFALFFCLGGYDAIFIQCIMVFMYRFRTLAGIVHLLKNVNNKELDKNEEVLEDIYKMHLNLLGTIDLFREYYSVYGLVQLANNLLVNCCLLYVLRANGIDMGSVSVWASSTVQVLIACALGEMLQDEAKNYSKALYNIDWLNLTIENRKYLLIMMTGSNRKVNIRAGGTYELNLALFLKIMKTTYTMCAVLQAL